MSRIDELKKIIDAAHKEIWLLRQADAQAKSEAMLGKFFKDRHSDLYLAVTRLEDGNLKAWGFHTEDSQELIIPPRPYGDDFDEISRPTYLQELDAYIARLALLRLELEGIAPVPLKV